jgi:peptide-methionine (R)-S-oxide reductase
MNRRHIMKLLSLLGLGTQISSTSAQTAGPEQLKLSDAQWKERLSPAQYDVLRHEGTERPGSSALNAEKRRGSYHCAGSRRTPSTKAAPAGPASTPPCRAR